MATKELRPRRQAPVIVKQEQDDDSDAEEPNLGPKKSDGPEPQIIHSGHFMVSSPHSEHPPKKGYDFDTVNKQTCQTYCFGKTSTSHLSIDASLTKLFECMTLAYRDRAAIANESWEIFWTVGLTVLPCKTALWTSGLQRKWKVEDSGPGFIFFELESNIGFSVSACLQDPEKPRGFSKEREPWQAITTLPSPKLEPVTPGLTDLPYWVDSPLFVGQLPSPGASSWRCEEWPRQSGASAVRLLFLNRVALRGTRAKSADKLACNQSPRCGLFQQLVLFQPTAGRLRCPLRDAQAGAAKFPISRLGIFCRCSVPTERRRCSSTAQPPCLRNLGRDFLETGMGPDASETGPGFRVSWCEKGPEQERQLRQGWVRPSLLQLLSLSLAMRTGFTVTQYLEPLSVQTGIGKLVSPKWKNFKGLKLLWRDKIRLNNAIWRAWYMQYVEKRDNPVCRFVTPLDGSLDSEDHRRPEAIVTDGKNWKRRIEIVIREYHKWRTYFKKRLQKHKDDDLSSLLKKILQIHAALCFCSTYIQMMENRGGWEDILLSSCRAGVQSCLEAAHCFSWWGCLLSCMLFANWLLCIFNPKGAGEQFSLFGECCHVPYLHNREAAAHAGNADMIQPGLIPLQPDLGFMDTFEPFQALFDTPTIVYELYMYILQQLRFPSADCNMSKSYSFHLIGFEFFISSRGLCPVDFWIKGWCLFWGMQNSNVRGIPLFCLLINHALINRMLNESQASGGAGHAVLCGLGSSVSPWPHNLFYFTRQASILPPSPQPFALPRPINPSISGKKTKHLHKIVPAPKPVTFLATGGSFLIFLNSSGISLMERTVQMCYAFSELIITGLVREPSGVIAYEKILKISSSGVAKGVSLVVLEVAEVLTGGFSFIVSAGLRAHKSMVSSFPGQPSAVIVTPGPLKTECVPSGGVVIAPTAIGRTSGLPEFHILQAQNSKHLIVPKEERSSLTTCTSQAPSPTAARDGRRSSQGSPCASEQCPSPQSPHGSSASLAKPEPQMVMKGRRGSHISAEQKRRFNIKIGFKTLSSLVSTLKSQSNSKPISNAATLQKTVEYIAKLQQERQQMQEEARRLKEEIEELSASINSCQEQLPATGVPITRHRFDHMRGTFDEYVKNRTLQNWKFWVFSIIIKPLFESFNGMVSTTSTEELCQTTLQWLDRHCSLPVLRPMVLQTLRHLSTTTSILSDPSLLPEQAKQAVTRISPRTGES
ncbi:MLXIP protein, partial [Atractosteus spatula]|nr:MLXIP protein [Atractosteus spatula]